MPDTNECLFLGEKKNTFNASDITYQRKKARQMQGCGESHENEGWKQDKRERAEKQVWE